MKGDTVAHGNVNTIGGVGVALSRLFERVHKQQAMRLLHNSVCKIITTDESQVSRFRWIASKAFEYLLKSDVTIMPFSTRRVQFRYLFCLFLFC